MNRAARTLKRSWLRVATDLGVSAATLALAAWILWPVYQTWRMPAVVALGGVLGVLSAAAVSRTARPGLWTVVAGFGGYLLTVLPVAVPAALWSFPQNLGWGIGQALSAPAGGWREIVTLTAPLGSYGAVLAPLYAAAILVGALAGLVALSRPGWVGWLALMLALSVAGAIGLGPSAVPAASQTASAAPRTTLTLAVVGAVWLLVCVVWLANRERIGQRRSAVSEAGQAESRATRLFTGSARFLRAAAVLAVAGAVGVFAAPSVVGSTPRTVARDSVAPAQIAVNEPSPLADFRRWFGAQAFDVAQFSVSGVDEGQRVRLAAMPVYDGASMLVASPQSPATFHVFAANRSGASTSGQQTATIRIEAYSSTWVPVVGDVQQIDFAGSRARQLAGGLLFDPVSGTVADVAPGDEAATSLGVTAGDEFTVHYDPWQEPEQSALGSAAVSLAASFDMPEMDQWLETQGAPGAGRATVADIRELAAALQARTYLSHSLVEPAPGEDSWLSAVDGLAFHASKGGHGLSRIDDAVFGPMNDPALAPVSDTMEAATAGDQEQFAVAMALVAMSQGFPARVVLGATVPADGLVQGGDVVAWTEIQAADGRWAVVDVEPRTDNAFPQTVLNPLPQAQRTPVDQDDAPTEAAPDQRAQSGGVSDPGQSDANDNANAASVSQRLGEVWRAIRVPVGAGLLLLAVGLAVFAAAVAKYLRSRVRARSRSAEARVVGSWDDTVDRAIDLGYRPAAGATRLEMAQDMAAPSATELAVLTDRAVFSDREPGPQDAQRADELARAVHTELNEGLSLRSRVAARLSWASLRYDSARDRRTERAPGKELA